MEGGLYSRFPGRKIVDSPFKKKVIVSYGIIAFAADTGKWLLVCKKSSASLIRILQGSYRMSDLKLLIKGVTKKEFETLKQASKDISIFDRLLDDFLPLSTVEDRLYGKERFLSASLVFHHLQEDSLDLRDDPEWFFPKGQTKSKTEHPIDCALREFNEKTGLGIGEEVISFFGQEPLVHFFDSCLGQRYETRCWVCIFLKQPSLPFIPTDHREIGKRKWMDVGEAQQSLSSLRMLDQAKEIITQHFSF